MSKVITPFSLKDAPSLIEQVFPVQKISAESYKEQSGVQSKTLISLGSYWRGRKPLVLNRACILGLLLPATKDAVKDLEIFEKLMAFDDKSLMVRLGLREGEPLPVKSYKDLVSESDRAESIDPSKFDQIWEDVNTYLGTSAESLQQLVEQLGIMRFGRRPKLADTFSGSGQIPFEAARLGCDAYASDLNPVACMLTWGAFNMVGASAEKGSELLEAQMLLGSQVQTEIDALKVETDGNGWTAKVYLYCVEVRCPQTGWMVPLLSTRLLSKGKRSVAYLVPNEVEKKYFVKVVSGVSDEELSVADQGTVRTDGEPFLVHSVAGNEYRTKISTLRGDFRNQDGITGSRLRAWEKLDFKPRPEDLFQERLYAIQWTRPSQQGKKGVENEFRSVTEEDLAREQKVEEFISKNIEKWQQLGWTPDMKIETGSNTDQPIRERGWTYWHHLFSARQLMYLGLTKKYIAEAPSKKAELTVLLARLVDWSSKLCRYGTGAARESVSQTFYNQALNTFFNYAVRPFDFAKYYLIEELNNSPIHARADVVTRMASEVSGDFDIFVTDPPYGDAVRYEEILEFFIAWLRTSPPEEFSKWIWDSRRALAIKGEDESFRTGMISSYRKMAECMPSNGIQIIMFTHQSGSIWADMANIVWASGLFVSAAWYIVTETDSALRDGSYVKGTVLLVLRKRNTSLKTSRDELAWEIQEEVEKQVRDLTGLNQKVKPKNRDENLFEDADLQMAGYAAALRVLTRYSIIDGRDMPSEAMKPRVRGQTTFVDSLIEFAVATANQALVPEGLSKSVWDKLLPAERFILKMTDLESKGSKKLDNYQNFAKAFKVRDFMPFMQSRKANDAGLKGAIDFGKLEMSEGSELYLSTLRAIYYAIMELHKETDTNEVLQHLNFNVKDYFTVPAQREMVIAISEYLAKKLETLRPTEASSARVLSELVRNQRIG
jgi:putative DNA methylase